jgi:hypothetical protein
MTDPEIEASIRRCHPSELSDFEGAMLALLDAERAKSAELQVKLDAAIAEGCEHAADLSASRLANKLLAETFARETEQYANRQKVYESHKKVMESVWDGHQKQFDEQAEIIETLIAERDEAIEALRPFVLERSKLSSGPNELVCTEDASHLIHASEIIRRHDERKKGGEA